jgi:hypothetical protein
VAHYQIRIPAQTVPSVCLYRKSIQLSNSLTFHAKCRIMSRVYKRSAVSFSNSSSSKSTSSSDSSSITNQLASHSSTSQHPQWSSSSAFSSLHQALQLSLPELVNETCRHWPAVSTTLTPRSKRSPAPRTAILGENYRHFPSTFVPPHHLLDETNKPTECRQ